MNRIEPPFVWAGSKMNHLSHVLPFIPPSTKRFVDAFGGSGAVLLNTPFHELDVFNDLNSNVANFFMVLQNRDTMEELIGKLELLVHSREIFDSWRDKFRADRWDFDSKVDQAVAWYYTIQVSFSRLGRHYGRNMRASFETRRVYERIPYFEQVHLRIRHAYIENKNALELIKEFDSKDTVFYLDPPYWDTHVGTYKGPLFGDSEHKALIDLIGRLKGRVILSGSECPYYDEVDFWSYKEKWPAEKKIKIESRSEGRMECLWVKH